MKNRTNFIVVSVSFVVVSVTASYFLLPSKQQMALNSYKDKQYDVAIKIYEQQLNDGNLSIDTVSTLAKIYIKYAEIDKAIEVMEKFVSQNPSNLEARQELGRLYQYGQRTADYAENLEIMNRLAADSESTKKLIDTYNLQNEDEKTIPLMLKKVIEENQGTLQEHRDLANVLAASKRYDKALGVLKMMKEKYADKMLFSDYELMLRMYIENKELKEAKDFALSLVGQKFSKDEFAKISNILLYLISAEVAYEFVDKLPDDIKNSDKLFEQKIVILQAVGKKEEAYKLALNEYEAGILPPNLIDDFIFLAHYVGNRELLAKLRDELNYDALGVNEVIGLLEIANEMQDKEFNQKLVARAEKLVDETNNEYLAVMLALIGGESEVEQRVLKLMDQEATFSRRLALAQRCAYRKMKVCVDKFFEELPSPEDMSDEELIGAIYVVNQSGDHKKAYEIVNNARQLRQNNVFENIWFPLAGAFAELELIKPYLVESAPLRDKSYESAYYMAMDYKNYNNAIAIAEYVYGLNASDKNGELVTQAYLASGDYDRALTLLRTNKNKYKNGENDYLYVLTKLAKSNPKYGKELREYGVAILESNVSSARKQQIIGSLIAGGQQAAIMPYIKSMAIENPKEWAFLYADYLKKTAGGSAVSEFWQQVAIKHHSDIGLRKQIAYNLLEAGEKQVAINMFMSICDDMRAKSSDELVSQLLYLWAPIYPEEAIVWLNNKAVQAEDVHEKRAWLMHMAGGVSDEGLIELANRQPALLKLNVVENRYIGALSENNQGAVKNYLSEQSNQSTEVERLLYYAAKANELGHTDIARKSYEKAVKQDPKNPIVLAKAGVFAASEANYTRSNELLNNYFSLKLPELPKTSEAYRAHFYQAENLRRVGRSEDSKKYYEAVIKAADGAPYQDFELHSMAAVSNGRIGDKAQAIKKFDELLKVYPDNRQIRSDYSALLIDMKEYDLAKKILPTWEKPENHGVAYEPVNISSSNSQLLDNGKRVLVDGNSVNAANLPWVAYGIEGKDSTMLVMKDNVKAEIMQDSSGNNWIHPKYSESREQSKIDRQFVVQNQLMNARVEVENGDGYEAAMRTRKLTAENPDNAQVLGFAANVENFNGNWPYARKLINKAHNIQPVNEDIVTLQRGIERMHGGNFYIDGAWRSLGDSDEYIVSVGGVYDVDDNNQVGIDIQNNSVDSVPFLLSDGRFGSFKDDKQRGEAFFRHFYDEGQIAQLSLFANNNEVGAGAYYDFMNQLGFSKVGIEWQRPDWQFVEGVLDDSTRNRAFVGHRYSPNNQVIVEGVAGVNQYNTRHGDNLSSTASFQGSVSYRIKEVPYFSVFYGLDAEYEMSEKNGRLSNGQPFQLFPMDSREVHSIGIFGSHNFSQDTNVEGLASYGYERIDSQSGPAVEGRVTHYFDDNWGVQARAGYGFRGGANDGSLAQTGVRLIYRY
jgi:tetratricopeptide (TPR) repeat protein